MSENSVIISVQLFLALCMLGIFLWVKNDEVPLYTVEQLVESQSWSLTASGIEIEEEAAKVYTLGWKQFPILQDCPENFLLNTLKTSLDATCIPTITPDSQLYEDIRILWIDATFASDGIDFVEAKEYFSWEGAEFFGTVSPGVAPNLGVLRINSDYLFADQKVFFIFYNQESRMLVHQRERIISYLTDEFRHLDDIRVHSFEDLRIYLAWRPQDSEIGRLFYYVWDCQYLVHGWCNPKLRTTGKFPDFSQAMIEKDIDILFVVPTTMVKIKRLDGLFKDVF